MAVIEVHGLTKRFGSVLAVDELSFEVGAGTVAGFLGRNGPGKTTTLRALLGLVTPDGGTATINGKRYADLPGPARQVGAVLEATGFYPGRTLLAAAVVGLLFGLAAAALTTGITVAFVAAKGYHLALAAGTVVRFAAGAVLAAGLLAAAGVGAGSLIRSQLAAILTVFAWEIVAEQVIGGLFTSIKPYLPYTAATTMAGSGAGGAGPLPFAAAAALIAAAALLAGAASRTTVRRDIT